MKSEHALSALIEATMAANGWTLDDVSSRAKKQGHGNMSPQNLSRIKNSPVLTLKPGQARALSVGLDLPVSTVIRAMLEAMGFTAADAEAYSPEDAIRHDEHLSARDRRVVTAVLTELRRTQEESDQRGSSPAPKDRAGSAGAHGVTNKDQAALAALTGVPAHMPDTTTGEETQDVGGDEPA